MVKKNRLPFFYYNCFKNREKINIDLINKNLSNILN